MTQEERISELEQQVTILKGINEILQQKIADIRSFAKRMERHTPGIAIDLENILGGEQ